MEPEGLLSCLRELTKEIEEELLGMHFSDDKQNIVVEKCSDMTLLLNSAERFLCGRKHRDMLKELRRAEDLMEEILALL